MSTFESDVTLLEEAVRAFVQVMKRPQRWTQVIEVSGVNLDRSSAAILHTLLAHLPKHLRTQDLAEHLGIEPPSVTRKTQVLEDAGYLKRTTDETDRRATILEVTAKGKKVSDKLMQAHRQIMSDALLDWPAKERHEFVSLFSRFSEDLMIQSKQQTTIKKKG